MDEAWRSLAEKRLTPGWRLIASRHMKSLAIDLLVSVLPDAA
jgi:hypothetical protein